MGDRIEWKEEKERKKEWSRSVLDRMSGLPYVHMSTCEAMNEQRKMGTGLVRES